jgi:membrane protease YdiL (CAAX protease family)
LNKPLVTSPVWNGLEMLALAAVFYTGMWFVGPHVQDHKAARLFILVLVPVAGAHIIWFSPMVLHRDPPELRGWGRRTSEHALAGSWRRAWRPYALLTATMAAVLLVFALVLRPAGFANLNWRAAALKFLLYIPYGTAQSIVFFGFIQARMASLIPYPSTALAEERHRLLVTVSTAALFSLTHLPNLPLMSFALVAGMSWSWLFRKAPNIVLLGLSHATLGTILHRVVELPMRVGPFYAEPDRYIMRNAIPGLKALIGDLY